MIASRIDELVSTTAGSAQHGSEALPFRLVERSAPRSQERKSAAREPCELLWLDHGEIGAARASPHLRLEGDEAFDEDSGSAASEEVERIVLARIMARARPYEPNRMAGALRQAASSFGGSPAIVLARGQLLLSVDDRAALEKSVRYTSMFPVADDKRVVDALALCRRVLDAGADLPREGVLFARARLREAVRGLSLDLDRGIESVVDRALVADRSFARRELFGAPQVLAWMAFEGGDVPIYLPEPAAARLPLFRRLGVRVIARVLSRQDAAEGATVALAAIAVGRLIGPAE